MPVVSRFLGITIALYWGDHAPPHFHAKYGEYEIRVAIHDGTIEGRFPRHALQLVLEWYSLHQAELLAGWERCRLNENPLPIEPLE